jgi:hypothetical protein
MSALGQKRTHAAQQKGLLFDHFVGTAEQCDWECEPKRLGGLEVDEQLDFSGLLDRHVGRLLALENPADV